MTAESPRVTPLPREQWDDRLTRVLATFPGGTEEPMNIFTTLARQPELFRRWLGFGGELLDGRLPGRLRELVILRTAARFDGRYEWVQHIALGRREGITDTEIASLGGELVTTGWAPLELAALLAVDETADDGVIADATWAVLAGHLDEAELVELTMLIAHYLMLATVLRSLRVQLEPAAQRRAAEIPGGPPERVSRCCRRARVVGSDRVRKGSRRSPSSRRPVVPTERRRSGLGAPGCRAPQRARRHLQEHPVSVSRGRLPLNREVHCPPRGRSSSAVPPTHRGRLAARSDGGRRTPRDPRA
jgi:alkylhydroperoxidase family enzyme